MSKTSYFTKDKVDRQWYVVDLDGLVLGRAAQGIARILLGKNLPQYTPGQDCGGFVVVLNADKVTVTGRKVKNKIYYRHKPVMSWMILLIPILVFRPSGEWH